MGIIQLLGEYGNKASSSRSSLLHITYYILHTTNNSRSPYDISPNHIASELNKMQSHLQASRLYFSIRCYVRHTAQHYLLKAAGCPGGLVVVSPRLLLALVLEFNSHRGEI